MPPAALISSTAISEARLLWAPCGALPPLNGRIRPIFTSDTAAALALRPVPTHPASPTRTEPATQSDNDIPSHPFFIPSPFVVY